MTDRGGESGDGYLREVEVCVVRWGLMGGERANTEQSKQGDN